MSKQKTRTTTKKATTKRMGIVKAMAKKVGQWISTLTAYIGEKIKHRK